MKARIFLLTALFATTIIFAQNVNLIPFQGQLAHQAGQPLSPGAGVTVVFRLYHQPVGGPAIWEESQPNISVNAGRFTVLLGSRTELPAHTNFNATLYLGLTIDDGNPQTTDVEMRPRQALVPVITANYAKHAQNTEKLGGFDWSALFGVNNPQGNILGSRISPGTLTSNEIAPQTITAAQLAPATITAAQIAPTTITGEKITSRTITSNQVATAGIDVSNLAQQVVEALVPAGTIIAYGGAGVPAGWVLCDGAQYARSAPFDRLFNAIGVAWGNGNGSTTFHVPDLRGYFLRGRDAGSSRDPDRGSRKTHNGAVIGDVVGSYQQDEIKSHQHMTSGYHPPSPWGSEANSTAGSMATYAGAGAHPSGALTKSAGGAETRPKNAYVNYIIKL